MLEAVALLAPGLVALRLYYHLARGALSMKMLAMTYGVFVLLINLFVYLIAFYLLGFDSIEFDGQSFINYVIAALVLSVIFPFVLAMVESTVVIDVKKNVRKK